MKKRYFASDFHLGLDKAGSLSSEREKQVVSWLTAAALDAEEIYLLGDIFDFWWEYREVVPKGFTRFFGAISSITDSGIPVHFFCGNHDLWANDYFADECGMTIHKSPTTFTFDGKKFHIAHGDGLGVKNLGKKFLHTLFNNKALQKIYSLIPPSIGVAVGQKWSQIASEDSPKAYKGEDNEDLIIYAKSILLKEKIDYFVFGHRHLAMNYDLTPDCKILFLGDWLTFPNYGVWDGKKLNFVKPPRAHR